jgi:hypothetical protein
MYTDTRGVARPVGVASHTCTPLPKHYTVPYHMQIQAALHCTIYHTQIQAALERVRQGADVMPRSQLEGVLAEELGSDWRSLMAEFDYEPKAAASIGQVRVGCVHQSHG